LMFFKWSQQLSSSLPIENAKWGYMIENAFFYFFISRHKSDSGGQILTSPLENALTPNPSPPSANCPTHRCHQSGSCRTPQRRYYPPGAGIYPPYRHDILFPPPGPQVHATPSSCHHPHYGMLIEWRAFRQQQGSHLCDTDDGQSKERTLRWHRWWTIKRTDTAVTPSIGKRSALILPDPLGDHSSEYHYGLKHASFYPQSLYNRVCMYSAVTSSTPFGTAEPNLAQLEASSYLLTRICLHSLLTSGATGFVCPVMTRKQVWNWYDAVPLKLTPPISTPKLQPSPRVPLIKWDIQSISTTLAGETAPGLYRRTALCYR
jgi:hypothetical protein